MKVHSTLNNDKTENYLHDSHYNILTKGIKSDFRCQDFLFLFFFCRFFFCPFFLFILILLFFSPVYVCVVNVGLQFSRIQINICTGPLSPVSKCRSWSEIYVGSLPPFVSSLITESETQAESRAQGFCQNSQIAFFRVLASGITGRYPHPSLFYVGD